MRSITGATVTTSPSNADSSSLFFYAQYEPVTVSDFAIASTEVTYKQWREVYEWATHSVDASNAERNTSANGYRLPTRLEWEYAARGGDQSAEAWNYSFSGTNDFVSVVHDSYSHDVRCGSPNLAGLYEMSGNVAEWCWDYDASNSSNRIALGAYITDNTEEYYKVTGTITVALNSPDSGIGFRVVRGAQSGGTF